MKRTKRTRPGSRFARLFAVILLATLSGFPAGRADKKPGSYAVIAGTVFRDTGLSLAGAQLELTASGNSKEARKIKKMQAASDARGEFAFRVPALAMRYRLSVKATGYVPEVKEVAISADERTDVFFKLRPASNQ